ncbi:MAG: type II toxin-antitoxin system VapC family toxin [bacterium]
MFVLDTNILIYYSRRDENVTKDVDGWLSDGELLAVSAIVEGELLSWPEISSHEISVIEDILATLIVVPVDSSVARVAAAFRRNYRVALLDGMIAATAFLRNATLVTRNIKDWGSEEARLGDKSAGKK